MVTSAGKSEAGGKPREKPERQSAPRGAGTASPVGAARRLGRRRPSRLRAQTPGLPRALTGRPCPGCPGGAAAPPRSRATAPGRRAAASRAALGGGAPGGGGAARAVRSLAGPGPAPRAHAHPSPAHARHLPGHARPRPPRRPLPPRRPRPCPPGLFSQDPGTSQRSLEITPKSRERHPLSSPTAHEPLTMGFLELRDRHKFVGSKPKEAQ